MKLTQPAWVCTECALFNGGYIIPGHCSTIHEDKCGVCQQVKLVTEPRDYGYLKATRRQRKWRVPK